LSPCRLDLALRRGFWAELILHLAREFELIVEMWRALIDRTAADRRCCRRFPVISRGFSQNDPSAAAKRQ
jgi:hypothetical protein